MTLESFLVRQPGRPGPLPIIHPNDPRFWSRVERSSGCWTWTGARQSGGYGLLQRRGLAPVPILAHRYSWYLSHGAWPPSDLFVCHRCDNPPCVNPSHLFLGTPRDNNDDKIAKGRDKAPPVLFGEGHPQAKAPDAVVREVRERHAAGESVQSLAVFSGVSLTAVRQWLRGDYRTSAGGPIPSGRASAA